MRVQLQGILFPSKEICTVQELYFHRTDRQICFDGYFNLFYIEKRKKYTVLTGLFLDITLKGYRQITLFHNRKEIRTIQLDSIHKRRYEISMPYESCNDGTFWFCVQEDERAEEKEIDGFYVGEAENKKFLKVALGIDICTYHREDYVVRNLRQITQRLLNNPQLDAASKVRIFLVDNGRSLDHNSEIVRLVQESNGTVQVYGNKNAGGAGGFTRGMLEILKVKEKYGLTHVLLMDDDAVIETDSIVRLYGLLTTLKEEWKNVSVGGALMREDYPYILLCAGEHWDRGCVTTPYRNLDVRDYNSAACGYLTETGHEYEWYSGWWWCCYSLCTVRADNLPLPVFIHRDDVEYCMRNRQQGMIFLNGVGVWHKAFEISFPGANLYYDIRNELITIALHSSGNKKKAALKFILKSVAASTIRMRYHEAKEIYQGVLDFLKGPEWLGRQDPVKVNERVRSNSLRYSSEDEVCSMLTEQEANEIRAQLAGYREHLGSEGCLKKSEERFGGIKHRNLIKIGKDILTGGSGICLLTSIDPPWYAFGKKKAVWYEVGSGRSLLVQRDIKQIRENLRICLKILLAFYKYFDPAVKNYQEKLNLITSDRAWKRYLEER